MAGKKTNTPVESVKHKDKRANIPTEELRDFVAEDEKMPKAILYPRDTSLDPQLVWKGKDEQDSKDLSVSVVSIYISDGFAVEEESWQYGRLPILLARINPDLSTGDELLKKTGAGNLFMVFGEPDVKVTKLDDGKLVVEIKGVDVYDHTTGQIRSHSTDDIACWFIDTDYNEESFFVHHAYFCGADEPYEKLKRALRSEINETAWSALYSTKSFSFDPPTNRKIAVKVINHYGDEVMRVFDLSSALDSLRDS